MSWIQRIKNLFKPQIEFYEAGEFTLTRKRIEDIEIPLGDWHWPVERSIIRYKYWCSCGTELTDGLSGGWAINAVCKKCNRNYGCLPGFWGH